MRLQLTWMVALFATLQFSFAQEKSISGTVTDESGIPLPGVAILVKESTKGTQTDFDGNYRISVQEGKTLVFSYVGMKSAEKKVGKNSIINVVLETDAQELEAVVVTAMGIKKKTDAITSTQQVVNSEQLSQAGNPNAVQALAGKVSGLQINQTNSGVVGSNSIVLRGRRSITGNNQALIVIDNVISNASVFKQIPQEIIESVNVIKGAQGAALYGADGVNGVIIVTTKNGTKNGKININISSNVDFQNIAYIPERQRNYGQGWDGNKINVENGAWGPSFGDPALKGLVPYGVSLYDYNNDGKIDVNPGTFDPTPDTDASIFSYYEPYGKNNIKEFFSLGTIISNDITLNAGDDKKYALLSLNNTERRFVVEGDEASRYSILFKGGAKLDRWTIEGSFNYIRNKVTQTNSGLYSDLLQSSVDIPIVKYKDYPDMPYAWNIYYKNPYWIMKHNRYNNLNNYFNSIIGVGYNFTDRMSIKYTANLRNGVSENLNYRDGWDNNLIPDVSPISSWLNKNNSYYSKYYGDLIFNFDFDINDEIKASLNIGNNHQNYYYNITSAGGDILGIPGLYTIDNIKKPTLPRNLNNGTSKSNSYAFFANTDISYKDYLFLNITARKEWSSVLPKDNNSYFYPSAGLSFIPTKAFKDFGGDILTYMKIAANWTRVGNASSIGIYSVNPTATIASGYPYSGGPLSFVNPTGQTDPNIKPEFVTSTEASVNLGFFKDKVNLGISVYQQNTKDMITYQSTSRASGLTRSLINVGQMETKGLEIDLGLTPFRSEDFEWNVNFSYSTSKSIILKVTDDTDEVNLRSGSMVGIFAKENREFPLIKANAYLRDNQGRVVIDQKSGNPLYSNDLQEFGSTNPKYILGFNTSIKYKGFKLGAVLDYRTGHYFFAGVAADMAFNGTIYESGQFDRTKGGFIMPNSVYKDATTGNYIPNTTVKTGGDSYEDVNAYYSSIYNRIGENFIIDATALKVRELSLSYTTPRSFLDKTGLKSVTLGIHARNPFIVLADDNLNYNDPEISNTTGNAQGIAGGSQYPTLKTYGVSLNIKF